jgi:hypothetical protein
LLARDETDYRVTDLAFAIIHPHSPEVRDEAARKAWR